MYKCIHVHVYILCKLVNMKAWSPSSYRWEKTQIILLLMTIIIYFNTIQIINKPTNLLLTTWAITFYILANHKKGEGGGGGVPYIVGEKKSKLHVYVHVHVHVQWQNIIFILSQVRTYCKSTSIRHFEQCNQ